MSYIPSQYQDSGRSGPSWDSLDAGGDEETLDTAAYAFANRDHILFAIDASQEMHTPMADEENEKGVIRGKSALHQVLEAVVKIERSKVITGPADSVGVVFYNVDTEQTPSDGHNPKGTYVMQPLRLINPSEIKRLIDILEEAQEQYEEQSESDGPTVEPQILREKFPPCAPRDELQVADLFTACLTLVNDGGPKLAGNKRVFLVTNNDEPPGSNANRAPARTRYSDLRTKDIAVDTYFISKPGQEFDPSLFWNEILERDDATVGQGGLADLAEIMNDLVIRTAPKRKQFTIPLKFGGKDGDIEIGVSGYSLVSEQKKGTTKKVFMRGREVEEIHIKTQYTSAETGAELDNADIVPAFQFGHESTIPNVLEPNWFEAEASADGQSDADGDIDMDSKPKAVAKTRLQFTDKEIRQFKVMGLEQPQIKILGFQSPNLLRVQDNIKHSYFIYPDETVYTGSTRTFTALLRSCLKLKRHALAVARLRANMGPEFCILVPQKETFDADGGQEDPPGFHVIIMPFVDDLRDPPRNMKDTLAATDDECRAMEKIMRKLRFKSQAYNPGAWPNPALAYHIRQLQALAFDEDFDTDEFEDKAKPKYFGIHKGAGSLMSAWKQLINEDERAVETLVQPKKRAAVELDPEDLADVAGAYETGTMDKLKVAELRNYAKYHRISLLGRTKKVDIIDAIEDHLDTVAKSKEGNKKAKSSDV